MMSEVTAMKHQLRSGKLRYLAILALLALGMGCGESHLPFDLATATGNWQVNFVADVTGNQRTGGGFLGQVGPSITGAFVLAGSCAGNGNVTGIVDRQDVTMNLSQIGQKLALIGTVSQNNKTMSGTYSSTITSCVTVPETGSWSAVQVQPVNGTFTASFTSSQGLGAAHLTGTLTQQPKPNGGTLANLNGPLASSDSPCVVLGSGTQLALQGTITGTEVSFQIFDLASSNGPLGNFSGTVSLDGKTIAVPDYTFVFPGSMTVCDAGSGTVTLP